MFVVKDDNPDVNFSIVPPSAADAEGNPIPNAKLSFEIVSDAPDVVALTTNPDDPLKGTAHFGKPGNANINVNVKTGDKLLGAFGAQFTVTTGDPAAIAGGTLLFDGLTEN